MSSKDENVPENRIKSLESQLGLARREINNLRQQLKSLNYVHRKECDDITLKLEEWRCLGCKNHQNTEDGSGDEAPSQGDLHEDLVKQIGVVHTNFPEKRGTPRQPGICPETVAKLVLNTDVFTNPNHALDGLQEFSHMWILFHFHRNDSTHVRAKVSPPRLNGIRTGVFATRSPHRPSPIGLSLVRIDRIIGGTIYFSGVDMVDRTPVFDIKPYIPQYDNPQCFNHSINLAESDKSEEESDFSRNNNPVASTSRAVEVEDNLNSQRVMDGEENRREQVLGAASVGDSNSRSAEDELLFTRLNSRMGEREAPDGEEEEPPPSVAQSQSVTHIPIPTTPEGHIRVPSWIDQPPVPTLTVTFKDRAVAQLNQLGPEGDEKMRIIANVLKEDPRSVYLRERWGSHCYVFRISELYVSCKFNDAAHTVTVYQVFQNAAPECDE